MTVADLHSEIVRHLDELKKCFKTPTTMTIVIRTPRLENGGIVVSDDSENPDDVIAEIRRFQTMDREIASGRDRGITKTEAGEIHVFGSEREEVGPEEGTEAVPSSGPTAT